MCKVEARNLTDVVLRVRREYAEKLGSVDSSSIAQLVGVVNDATRRPGAIRSYLRIFQGCGRLFYDRCGDLYRANGKMLLPLPLLFLSMIFLPITGGMRRLSKAEKVAESRGVEGGNEMEFADLGNRLGGVWVLCNDTALRSSMDDNNIPDSAEAAHVSNQHVRVVFRHVESTVGDMSDPSDVESAMRKVLDAYVVALAAGGETNKM